MAAFTRTEVVAGLAQRLAASCGGGGEEKPDAKATEAENEQARSALLTAADFPPGWQEAQDPEGPSPLDSCEQKVPFEGLTGRAESGDLSSSVTPDYSQVVRVFDTPEHARASLKDIPARWDCAARLVNLGKLDSAKARFSEAKWRRVRFARIGD